MPTVVMKFGGTSVGSVERLQAVADRVVRAREAGVGVIVWSGLGKMEDLDLLHPGELAHVHFQDVPDMPRELLDNTTRFIPGDGVSPLVAILRKLAEKSYSGALSVELFLPEFQQGDPYEVAMKIREKAEAVMHKAKVA